MMSNTADMMLDKMADSEECNTHNYIYISPAPELRTRAEFQPLSQTRRRNTIDADNHICLKYIEFKGGNLCP
jgi:hypothetical protein